MAKAPKEPGELGYLWHWYLEIRTSDALTFSEIKAWSELTRRHIKPWEVDILRTIDLINWQVING